MASPECRLSDNDDSDNEYTTTTTIDPADILLQRGAWLRQLREMERQDEAERAQQQQVESTRIRNEQPNYNIVQSVADGQVLLLQQQDEYVTLSDGDTSSRMLRYDSYLAHQRYYDDLKHIDYRYIDFGRIFCMIGGNDDNTTSTTTDQRPLVVEQDKTLGKGGLCWDAAFILGEYVIVTATREQQQQSSSSSPSSCVTIIIIRPSSRGMCRIVTRSW